MLNIVLSYPLISCQPWCHNYYSQKTINKACLQKNWTGKRQSTLQPTGAAVSEPSQSSLTPVALYSKVKWFSSYLIVSSSLSSIQRSSQPSFVFEQSEMKHCGGTCEATS